jgi:glucosamine--fructose-6-phosphate aminotransferase (isomerizing)
MGMASERREAPDAGTRALTRDFRGKGAALLAASPDGALPVLSLDNPETDAACLIQTFHAMMVRLAARRGIDPDRLRHLQKVTRTQ